MDDRVRTACPRNCYSTCTMSVRVEDGRVRAIEPDARNRATTEGICLKGLSHVERVYAKDRLLYPLKRKGDGRGFTRVSWEEAIDTIATVLVRLKKTHGPQSVLFYAGSGTKGLLNEVGPHFWRLYGGCTTTFGDLCWPAGLEATRLTLGDNKHNAPWDLENAKLIVLWGKNPSETNIHQMPFIENALARGGRLVVVDPRRTQSAESAELLIQPRPGTDGALALAAARLLIDAERIDRTFVGKHVLGFKRFREAVRPMTPAVAAAITDVPVAAIHRLAELLGTIKPATINAGFGMQRYTNSGQTMRSIIALLALTGNVGLPGAGWVYANLQSHLFDAVRDPLAIYPPENPDGTTRVAISTARLGADMRAAIDPPVKMIWVERGNPVTQNPETHSVLAAIRALDFRVVVDQFLTDTAREADLILPAKTFFEQTDVINAYWHPYIQLKQKVIDPPGEVKPETEIYHLLAHRLGLPTDSAGAQIPAPSDAAVEEYLARRLDPIDGLSLDRLRQGPLLAPGFEEVAFADRLFPTPSGRIEIFSAEAEKRWGCDPLPLFSEPIESWAKSDEPARSLYLMTPNTKNRIHSQFNNLDLIRQVSQRPFLAVNPSDARARSIVDGQRVKVSNSRGSLELEVRLDFSLKAGCVVVENGWWIAEGGAVNVCSAGRETDMGHGAAFHDNLVEIERVD